jgi:CheY-like chemotaxis protein
VRVLIVEDDVIVAADIAGTLASAGARVTGTAFDQQDALRLSIESYPDVVVMDIRLRNGGDGIVAAQAIRALLGTPVVFCTGNSDPMTLRRIEAFGGAEFLLKPFDCKSLIEAVARACRADFRTACRPDGDGGSTCRIGTGADDRGTCA